MRERASTKRSSLTGLLVVALPALVLPVRALAAPLPNEFCPVMKEKRALAEFTTMHEGRRVHFCCENCREAFKASPQAFLANLPPLAVQAKTALGHDHAKPASGHVHGPGFISALGHGSSDDQAVLSPADWSRGESLLASLASPHSLAVLAQLRWPATLLLPALGFLLYRSRRQPDVEAGRRVNGLGLAAALGGLLVLVLGWIVLTLKTRLDALEGTLRASGLQLAEVRVLQNVHYATFLDFGWPPMPQKPPLPPQLAGTFYRGNDEREPALFNGGHYRTATFHLSLRSDDRPLTHGAEIGPGPIHLRVEVERGPNTPDFFWIAPRMATMFLTRDPDPALGAKRPVPDRVGLEAVVPMQRWAAVYPLGPLRASASGSAKEASASGDGRLTGIVYLREQMEGGARFHYGIPYDLRVRGGRVAPESDLWMGALYRTRKVSLAKLPAREWFSHEPIPTLPVAREVDASTLRDELDSGTNRP